MGGGRSYTDGDLARAVAGSRSWRGVLRELGLAATSASAMRSVRFHAERLGLDHSHFTGQRRWSDDQLADAVRSSRSWAAVADRLGLRGGSSTTMLKGHAARLELDTAHLSRATQRPSAPPRSAVPRPARLSRAGTLLAAGWLTLCGYDVSWPLEPTVYDLVVSHGGGFERIQVKTTTVRAGATWLVRLTRSSRSHDPYDLDEIDSFAVIDGDLCLYLIPARVVGGLQAIHMSAYADYLVLDGRRVAWDL